MKTFSVNSFYETLVGYMADKFPYMANSDLDRAKHKDRSPLHLKEAVFGNLLPIIVQDKVTFDIGSETLERTHPYYHILQDAQVIRKAHRGTDKSKGSQAKVEDVGKRDYGRVTWNGKTFTKEYSRNVRGARSLVDKSSHWIEENGKRKFINREANYYENIHYKYLDKMLDEGGIAQQLADDFGLILKSSKSTGLKEEYAMQEGLDISAVEDMIASFTETDDEEGEEDL